MIAIVGAGSIGCYYGGLIALSGQPTVFIAKHQRAVALKERGLCIRWPDSMKQISVAVTEEYGVLEQAHVVLICLKTTQSLQVAKDIQPYLKPKTLVVSMQNGLTNAHDLSAILGMPVYVAMIYGALAMVSDYEVSFQGGGQLVLGDPLHVDTTQTALLYLLKVFEQANCAVTISPNITQDLWNKWIINCAINGLSALGNTPYQDLFQQPSILEIIEAIVQECFALAKKEQVVLNEQGILEQIRSIPSRWPLQKSSMAQDVLAKKATEIAALNGLAVRKGDLYGIATPMNKIITALIQLQEQHY